MTAEALHSDANLAAAPVFVDCSPSADDWRDLEGLAEVDPSLSALLDAVARLAESYQGAVLLLQPLRDTGERIASLPAVPLGPTWSPSRCPALLVCDGWPDQRPLLLLHESVRQNGAVPTTAATRYVVGHSWVQFSFNASYSAASPSLIPVVRGWLRRFDGRP